MLPCETDVPAEAIGATPVRTRGDREKVAPTDSDRAGAADRFLAAQLDVQRRGQRAPAAFRDRLRHLELRLRPAFSVARGLADLSVAGAVDAVADDGARPAPAARVAGVRGGEVAHTGVA